VIFGRFQHGAFGGLARSVKRYQVVFPAWIKFPRLDQIAVTLFGLSHCPCVPSARLSYHETVS